MSTKEPYKNVDLETIDEKSFNYYNDYEYGQTGEQLTPGVEVKKEKTVTASNYQKRINTTHFFNTGNVSYTGFGFEPKRVVIRTIMFGPRSSAWCEGEVGYNQAGGLDEGAWQFVAGNVLFQNVIVQIISGANNYTANFVSFDSDGFTLNWQTATGTSVELMMTAYNY